MPRPRTKNSGHTDTHGLKPKRLGGHVALDFLNTVDRDQPEPEHFTGYGRLIAWCEESAVLTPAEARALERRAAADPAAAARELETALRLRATTARLCTARVAGKPPARPDLAAFNQLLHELGQPGELSLNGLGYVRRSGSAEPDLAEPVRRILELVADFLASPDFARVRLCEGPDCGWLFIDRSPAQRRRWCSMEGCGNRAKAQRHYRQKKSVAD